MTGPENYSFHPATRPTDEPHLRYERYSFGSDILSAQKNAGLT